MNKKLKNYLLYTFLLAWILQVVAAVFYHKGASSLYSIVVAISMFMPMVGGLLSGHSLKGLGWKLSLRRNWKILLLSWFGPAFFGSLGALLFFLVFPKAFDGSLSYMVTQIGPEAFAQLEAQGITPPVFILIEIAAALLYAPIVNAFFAVGEEIGWRGIMNPHLKERFGSTKGLLVSGVIWGMWHWPLMILTGYEYGSGYWGFPFLGMVLFCFVSTTFGILLDYFYEKSGSIIYPAIAHGAINGFAGIPLLFLNSSYSNYLLLGPTMVGLLAILPPALCSFWMLYKNR